MKKDNILVIDLFAGPGGLGEGIASYQDQEGHYPFHIGMSIEKEASAHKTLTTRAFFRKTTHNVDARAMYYAYARGDVTREQLFEDFPEIAEKAQKETLYKPHSLGDDNEAIHNRIIELTQNHQGTKVVIGGPPCQAYSLAGRSRNAGNSQYKAEEDHRHFLYREYLEVLAIAQPEAFVMENVRGILSAKVNNQLMFPQIISDLQCPGAVTKHNCKYKYKIYSLVKPASNPEEPLYSNSSDFLIRSEHYGIPQARHRVILLGIREDINHVPNILKPINNSHTSVREAIGDLPALRSGFSKQPDNEKDWRDMVNTNAKKLACILKKNHKKATIDKLSLKATPYLKRTENQHNINFVNMPKKLESWIIDSNLKCVLNHETRGHIATDLLRYAFCAAYAKLNSNISPKSRDFPEELAPAHKNWKTGKHADRFRVQVANKEATTITSHISKDGHYFIHYDPQQCRSLTVREAARLQTFPDNYLFEGNRTQQYVQVGNAVPPYLAQQIGEILSKLCDVKN